MCIVRFLAYIVLILDDKKITRLYPIAEDIIGNIEVSLPI